MTEPLVASAVFDEHYRYFYADRLGDGRSMADTALIWGLGDVGIGDLVLDLGCGHGRIANRIAQRGARVIGVDISPQFLTSAAADARSLETSAQYVRSDLRSLPFLAVFDLCVCWYTTFGYFDSAGDRAVLDGIFASLRPGGRLLLDVNLLEEDRPPFAPAVVVERGDDLMVEQVRFDRSSGVVSVTRTVARGKVLQRDTYAIRLYRPEEIGSLLEAAGFSSINLHPDSVDLGPHAHRLVVEARRPGDGS